MARFILTIDEVTDILNDLNPNKALGPDGIPTRVVRTCSEQLALPLTLIFNTSLQTGVFPSLFKRGNVVPIFKSGPRNEASNYRPISLLPIFSKVFEKAVFPHIYNHVQNSLDINQHGFVKGHSTVTNLVSYTDYLSTVINNRGQVDSTYLHFSKAFDSVNHRLLLYKLSHYGLNGSILNWFHSYLSNRVQRVTLNGHLSSWCNVTSGVPKGS